MFMKFIRFLFSFAFAKELNELECRRVESQQFIRWFAADDRISTVLRAIEYRATGNPGGVIPISDPITMDIMRLREHVLLMDIQLRDPYHIKPGSKIRLKRAGEEFIGIVTSAGGEWITASGMNLNEENDIHERSIFLGNNSVQQTVCALTDTEFDKYRNGVPDWQGVRFESVARAICRSPSFKNEPLKKEEYLARRAQLSADPGCYVGEPGFPVPPKAQQVPSKPQPKVIHDDSSYAVTGGWKTEHDEKRKPGFFERIVSFVFSY